MRRISIKLVIKSPGNDFKKDAHSLTPLHLAAFYGQDDFIRFLLANGGDREAQSNNGERPWHLARYMNRQAAVALLMARGVKGEPADYESCPTVSPDGRYLFFGRDDDIYWVSAGIIERLRRTTLSVAESVRQ